MSQVETALEALFTLRERAIRSPELRTIYNEVVTRLRGEAASRAGFGTLEALMVERVAFLYVWIRDREEMGVGSEGLNPENPEERPGFVHERNYRETLAMWWDMASDLQKAEAKGDVEDQFIVDKVLKEAARIVIEVCDETLSKPEAKAMKARFADRFDTMEL